MIVLNYRTPMLVLDCLESLRDQIDGETQRVVVVDNHSGDDSADVIEQAIVDRQWGGWAGVVRSPVNRGFAAGNNVGVRSTDAEIYVLLNSDTIVRAGAIQTMLESFKSHPDVDMLGPRLEWPDGTHQTSTFRYRTPLTELIYGTGLGLMDRMFPRHVVARELHEWTKGIGWASFACIAIRREVFDRVGLLDERYFMYFEDMAFCRKATHAGCTIAYEPAVRVVHLRGGSSPVKEATRQRKRRPMYYSNARSQYFHTFYGVSGFLLANVLWTVGWCIGLLRGRSSAVAKEWRDIWASPQHAMGDRA